MLSGSIEKCKVREIELACEHYGINYKQKLNKNGNISVINHICNNGYAQEALDVPPMIFHNRNFSNFSIGSFKKIYHGRIYTQNPRTSDFESMNVFETEYGDHMDPFTLMELNHPFHEETTPKQLQSDDSSIETAGSPIKKYVCQWDKKHPKYEYILILMQGSHKFEVLTDEIIFFTAGAKCMFIRLSSDGKYNYGIEFTMKAGMTYDGSDIGSKTLYFTSYKDIDQIHRVWTIWELDVSHIVRELLELNLNEGFDISKYKGLGFERFNINESNKKTMYLNDENLFNNYSSVYQYTDNITYREKKFDHKDSLRYEIIGHDSDYNLLFKLEHNKYSSTIPSSSVHWKTSENLMNYVSNGIMVEFCHITYETSTVHFINMIDYVNKTRILLPRDLMLFRYYKIFNFNHYFIFIGTQLTGLNRLELKYFYVFNCTTKRFRKVHIDINFNEKSKRHCENFKIDENGNLYYFSDDECYYYDMSHIYYKEPNVNDSVLLDTTSTMNDDEEVQYKNQMVVKPMQDIFPNMDHYSDIKVILEVVSTTKDQIKKFEYDIHSWMFSPIVKNSFMSDDPENRTIIIKDAHMNTVNMLFNILVFVYGDRFRNVHHNITPLLSMKKERMENGQLESLLINITKDKQVYENLQNYFHEEILSECGELPLAYSRKLAIKHIIIRNKKLLTKDQLIYIEKNYYVFIHGEEIDDVTTTMNLNSISNDTEFALLPKYIAECKIPFLYEKKKMLEHTNDNMNHLISLRYPMNVIRFFIMSCYVNHFALKYMIDMEPDEMVGCMTLADELGSGQLFLTVFIKYVIDTLGNTTVANEKKKMKLAVMLLNPNIVLPSCVNIIRCWVLSQIETMFTKKQLIFFIMQSVDDDSTTDVKSSHKLPMGQENIKKRQREQENEEEIENQLKKIKK